MWTGNRINFKIWQELFIIIVDISWYFTDFFILPVHIFIWWFQRSGYVDISCVCVVAFLPLWSDILHTDAQPQTQQVLLSLTHDIQEGFRIMLVTNQYEWEKTLINKARIFTICSAFQQMDWCRSCYLQYLLENCSMFFDQWHVIKLDMTPPNQQLSCFRMK